mgnify:CR=1 FL=1
MDQCTENYECLVINNNSKSDEISEKVGQLSSNYSDKADQFTDEFMAEMGSQISLLNQKINGLKANLDRC